MFAHAVFLATGRLHHKFGTNDGMGQENILDANDPPSQHDRAVAMIDVRYENTPEGLEQAKKLIKFMSDHTCE